SIFHNHFENLGQSEAMFSGALSFRNYQEGYTYVNISFNSFKNCSNYIMLRNNAMTVNQEHFVGTINYNQFVGIPKQYYLNNKNAIDSVSTNPNTINMDYNYYSNELGLSINLTEHSENFDGYSSNENQLSSLDDFENYPKIYGSNVVRLDTLPKLIFNDGIIFASSNPNIATVDQEGEIVPLTFGEVIISASNGSYETKFRVVVKPSLNIDYVKKILEIAIGEEGYVEGTNNDTKYGTWYGMPNQPWCAMFVSWSANQAKISTTIIPKYASVSLGMQWFQEHQLFKLKGSYIPKAGDIIFFKSDGASHTGLVISSDGVKVYTIEGNTSNMVAKRNYLLNYSTITGYGTPNYPTYSGEPFVFDVSDSTDGSGANTR
ncbi:MAG: CHAP domain-containing protein, partial [Bacilli bacterium]